MEGLEIAHVIYSGVEETAGFIAKIINLFWKINVSFRVDFK
jgi:hypothetical protein